MLAISPAFIIESAQILTETVYIFLLTGGVWLYVESLPQKRTSSHNTSALLCAAAVRRILLGLATLTRAVLLAFPFVLAIHLLIVTGWRKGWRHAALLLLVYALVVSTWTVYSLARWNRFVIAGEGLAAFLYMGATGWTSAQEVDQQLAQQSPSGDYAEARGQRHQQRSAWLDRASRRRTGRRVFAAARHDLLSPARACAIWRSTGCARIAR